MPRITRPNENQNLDPTQTSLAAAASAGAGQVALGRTIASVGKASQQSNQLALSKQVASIIDREGQILFAQSKKADNSAVVLNKSTEATEEFIKAQQARYNKLTDDQGNPNHDRLHTDISDIGNDIMERTASTITDRDAADKFKKKFSGYVANQKISALKFGLKKQVEFGRASLDKGLSTLVRQAATDDLDQALSYEQQGVDSIREAFEGGLISQPEMEDQLKAFSVMVRDASLRSVIQKDRVRAAETLQMSAEDLGIPEDNKQQLNKILDAGVKSDAAEIARAAELSEVDQDAEEASVIESTSGKIQAGALREDELLGLEGKIADNSFNQLRKDFVKMSTKRDKELKEVRDTALRISEGRSIEDLSPKRINQFYDHAVRQAADATGQNITLSQKAQIAAIIPRGVGKFATELESALKFGDPSNAAEVLSAYTYIKDRNKPTLDSKFDKQAVLMAEHLELLVERGGMDPTTALSQTRESLSKVDDKVRSLNEQSFRKEDAFKVTNLEETAADAFDAETFFFGTNQISQDAVVTFKEFAREGYLQTGNKDSAIAYAKSLMNKTHGFSTVSGDRQFMFSPPEKHFPDLNPEELRNVLVFEVTPQLPEGIDPESVAIESDDITAGNVQVTGTQNGEEVTRSAPSWVVTYSKDVDGVPVKVPLLDEETGRPKRWSPAGTTMFQEQAAEQFKTAAEQEAQFKQEQLQQTQESALKEEQELADSLLFIGPKTEQEAPTESKEQISIPEADVSTKDVNPNTIIKSVDIVAPKANPQIKEALSANSDTLVKHGIDNKARLKAFVAQMSHESANFKALVERRSDSSAERKYGVGTRVGRNLGNVRSGDGAKFKGRGIIQLTGRDNYTRIGKLIGQDLVGNPELAADPKVAVEIAAVFWKEKGLNKLADQGRFKEITRRINGGYNGLADRKSKFRRLLRADI